MSWRPLQIWTKSNSCTSCCFHTPLMSNSPKTKQNINLRTHIVATFIAALQSVVQRIFGYAARACVSSAACGDYKNDAQHVAAEQLLFGCGATSTSSTAKPRKRPVDEPFNEAAAEEEDVSAAAAHKVTLSRAD